MKLICPNSCKIFFAPGMYLYLALLVLLLPIPWLAAATVAVTVHELFHIIAIKALRLRIYSVRIGMDGTRIHTEPLTEIQELICSLAGPLGGSILIFLADRAPIIALCAWFQTAFNLLPMYPFDGGRALRSCMNLLFSGTTTDIVCRTAEVFAASGVILLGIYCTLFLKIGILPIALAGLFLIRSIKTKISLQTT